MRKIFSLIMSLVFVLALAGVSLAQTYQDGTLDKITGETAITAHGSVAAGRVFTVTISNATALAANTAWNCTLWTATSKKTVLKSVYAASNNTSQPIRVTIYEVINATALGGTADTLYNRDRTSAGTASSTFRHGTGTKYTSANATDSGYSRSGTAVIDSPIILKPNRPYVIKVLNEHAVATTKMVIRATIYER